MMEKFRENQASDIEQTKFFLESHNNAIALIFHRHAEHDNDHSKPDEYRLLSTDTDIDKTLEMSGLIDYERSIAYSFDTLRSFLTSYYLLVPDAPVELDSQSQNLRYHDIKSGLLKTKIRSNNELNYKDPSQTTFFEGLSKAYLNKKTLEFLVNESNQFLENGEDISAYSVISHDVAKIVNKYLKVIPRWNNLSKEKFQNKNLYRTFCAREMIYGCFRARVTELVQGKEARDVFVSSYDASISDKKIGVILIKDSDNVVLNDGFDELQIPVSCLEEI